MIGGFIISGNSPKKVIIRALGPSLASSGISDVLPDPTLDLRGPDGSRIAFNDNWKESQEAEIEATGVPPPNDLEAAIVTTLAPGSYTAILRGNAQASGIALLEVYDLDIAPNSKLANLSTRARVQTGDSVLIGGFRLGGIAPRTIVVRAIGPSLTQAGLANALADPTLELRDSQGALLFANDNWKEDGAGGVLANAIKIIGLSPTDDRESALMATVPPGPYTAIVAGKNNTVGIGLVEVYNLQ
jgi:hypothetical protein